MKSINKLHEACCININVGREQLRNAPENVATGKMKKTETLTLICQISSIIVYFQHVPECSKVFPVLGFGAYC